MKKTIVFAGILVGAISLALLYPVLVRSMDSINEPRVEQLDKWTNTNVDTVANSSATLSVNATSPFSCISRNVSIKAFRILTLTWIDSACLQSATYQVRILQGTNVIISVFKTLASEEWLGVGSNLKISHFYSAELPAGQYTIQYLLQGNNGNVTISEVSVADRMEMWVARRMEALAPFLIVLAIGVGVAASASMISSVKKDVELLKTLLNLKG